MKNTYQCPKCNSVDVIKIEGSRMNQNHWISLAKWGATNAVLDRFLCTTCGYVEEWVQMDRKFTKWVEKKRTSGGFDSEFV